MTLNVRWLLFHCATFIAQWIWKPNALPTRRAYPRLPTLNNRHDARPSKSTKRRRRMMAAHQTIETTNTNRRHPIIRHDHCHPSTKTDDRPSPTTYDGRSPNRPNHSAALFVALYFQFANQSDAKWQKGVGYFYIFRFDVFVFFVLWIWIWNVKLDVLFLFVFEIWIEKVNFGCIGSPQRLRVPRNEWSQMGRWARTAAETSIEWGWTVTHFGGIERQ